MRRLSLMLGLLVMIMFVVSACAPTGEAFKKPKKEASSLLKKVPSSEPLKVGAGGPFICTNKNEIIVKSNEVHLCVKGNDYVCKTETTQARVDLSPESYLSSQSYVCGSDPWEYQAAPIWVGCYNLAPATYGISGWAWSTPSKYHTVKGTDGCGYECKKVDDSGEIYKWVKSSYNYSCPTLPTIVNPTGKDE